MHLYHLLRNKKLHTLMLAVTFIALLAGIPQAVKAASDDTSLYLPMLSYGGSPVTAAAAASEPGAVYVLTNPAGANGVAIFGRAANGALTYVNTVPTGGVGTGASLGSQGALSLSPNGRWLFAANAGSNDVSVFSVQPGGLILTDQEASGGSLPNSVTYYKGVLYVLNSGAPNNITGFTLSNDGQLTMIPGSTRSLSAAATGPAQISFTPDGSTLVVTEKATSKIDTYTVDSNGLASAPNVHDSLGLTPFGFAFAGETLVVSEAPGSAVSSYRVDANDIAVVTPSLANGQIAACWMAATKNGKYAYSANAGSSNVSSYGVAPDGSLTLLAGAAGGTGAGTAPVDMAMSHNSQFLYVLSASSRQVIAFAVQADGSLVSLGDFAGFTDVPRPAGIAAW